MASLMQIASKVPRHTLTTALKTTWPPTMGAKTTIANLSSTMPIQVPSASGRSFGTSSRFFGLKEPKAHGPKDPRTKDETIFEKGLYFCVRDKAECEAAINKQINLELYTNYVYTSMAFYFDRSDVALPGFHKYFKKAAEEEKEHALHFMEFQNKCGGRIVLNEIKKPDRDEWGSGLEAMKAALALEKKVHESILQLHQLASNSGCQDTCQFLDGYLEEQVRSIKELADHVARLSRVGPGLGEHLYDKDLAGS